MPDKVYCYPDSNVLKNKLHITDGSELFEAEKELTSIRLFELQENPLEGDFDYKHLRAIHKYIFQDVYEWAGQLRTVEIGKGNLFCTTACLEEFGNSIFSRFFKECYECRDDFETFVRIFAEHYGDLNALHPFREGNGRTQREFARCICLKCGYDFDLSCTTHSEMLAASILSFDRGDNSQLQHIFTEAISPSIAVDKQDKRLRILSLDDLDIVPDDKTSFETQYDVSYVATYTAIYQERTIQNLESVRCEKESRLQNEGHNERDDI